MDFQIKFFKTLHLVRTNLLLKNDILTIRRIKMQIRLHKLFDPVVDLLLVSLVHFQCSFLDCHQAMYVHNEDDTQQ